MEKFLIKGPCKIKGQVNISGSKNAAIQFTLVFDSAEQQSTWYSFLRWLKDDPGYSGETTTTRLLDFIASHSPKG